MKTTLRIVSFVLFIIIVTQVIVAHCEQYDTNEFIGKKFNICNGNYAIIYNNPNELKQKNLIMQGEAFNIVGYSMTIKGNSSKEETFYQIERQKGEMGWVKEENICLALSIAETNAINARKDFAIEYGNILLQQGMTVATDTAGGYSTKLIMRCILFNRSMAYQLSTNLKFMSKIKTLGFKEIELSDGHKFTCVISAYGQVNCTNL
ncbi:MAG: hypothetical protein HQK96_18750 [Nitrospirae bacterium]|nr:hypothetical protein [Nitrospirota bacterium]